ncbi:twin transmembrane helix small protein [Hwanghaeella sp.]|uniref:twin transmembrane helix small protein n=1 Tax=Hwanghaeella sp. TaxID=2605943 RepID=UPI003CCB783E
MSRAEFCEWYCLFPGAISLGMAVFAIILMVVGMIATVAILATGIYSMVRGGEFNDRWGNRLMRYRIVAQGFALAMFALGLMLLRNGG